jgi:hypothetical protein
MLLNPIWYLEIVIRCFRNYQHKKVYGYDDRISRLLLLNTYTSYYDFYTIHIAQQIKHMLLRGIALKTDSELSENSFNPR